MSINDLFDNQLRRGNINGNFGVVGGTKNAQSKKVVTDIDSVTSFQNSNIDDQWSEGYVTMSTYYDNYFAGQDIKVTLDGVEDDFPDIPILNMGFNIEQQKTPVYGLWSYTYDGVMRGTRIVSGTLSIATTSADYMTRLLSKAASSRRDIRNGVGELGATIYGSGRQLTADDSLIDTYWSKNIDPAVGAAGKNIHSVHPPFSLVILYGIQNTSISPTEWSPTGGDPATWDTNVLNADINERLVEGDPNKTTIMRRVLEACEITSMQTGFAPDGSVVAETYSFFARDTVLGIAP